MSVELVKQIDPAKLGHTYHRVLLALAETEILAGKPGVLDWRQDCYNKTSFHQFTTAIAERTGLEWGDVRSTIKVLRNMDLLDDDGNFDTEIIARYILTGKLPGGGFFGTADSMRAEAECIAQGTTLEAVERAAYLGKPSPLKSPIELPKSVVDLKKKIEDKNEPVFIVRTEDEKWGLWYTLIDERWRRSELSKWYAHNCIFTCEEEDRNKIIGLVELKFLGALSWKPIVLTFKDEELERKLLTVNPNVSTIENPQSIEQVHKELAKFTPLPEISVEEEHVPEFPRLPGALGKLVDGLTPDFAYDHKALAALTYIGIGLAGRVKISSHRWLQTRFYSCMVGPPGSGKSAPDAEMQRALFETGDNCVLPDVRRELSIDSGPALVQALEEHRRMILTPDEIADQFEKAKITGTGKNSLFGEFLKLYEGNRTANRTKERGGEGGLVEVHDALLAIMGSVTTDRFEPMWQGTGATSSGLMTRFVYSYSEKVPARIPTPNDEEALAWATTDLAEIVKEATDNTLYLSVSPEAEAAINNWRPLESDRDENKIRILDMAKRFAMIVAACNRADQIDEPTMRLALEFADYQIALREKLCPPDASSAAQAFEQRTLKFYKRVKRSSLPQAVNYIRPERFKGGFGAFNQAWSALVHAGKLVQSGKTRKGEIVWEIAY